ncbi:endonuclease [Escherichia phage vB_EcoP_EP32B]|nr:endonuclease [Escherichia phage vB_EcoP_EP32B]
MRLKNLPTFILSNEFLTSEMKVKIADTARYSLTNKRRRCSTL